MDGLPKAMWRPAVEASFVDEVRNFVKERIIPLAHEIDAEDLYPAEIVRDLARLGCNAISLPTKFGGLGLDTHTAWPLARRSVMEAPRWRFR